jgi:acyl carrier protein
MMTQRQNVPAEVKEVFLKTFNVPESSYSENLGPGDIQEWDSLGNVRLIQAIETHFEISIDIMDLFEIETLSDIIVLVERHRS